MAKSWMEYLPKRASADLEELAGRPYMGQTATFDGTNALITDHDSKKGWLLEFENGKTAWMKDFAPDEGRTENNALVAASRSVLPEGTDIEGLGTVGSLTRDEEGEWAVLSRIGKVIDLAQVFKEAEFDDPSLHDVPERPLDPEALEGPDESGHVCPECGSEYIALGPNGFTCQDCGAQGSQEELDAGGDPEDELSPEEFERATSPEAAPDYPSRGYSSKEAAPMALPSQLPPGYDDSQYNWSAIEIGDPQREYEVTPLHLPATEPSPAPSPAPEETPVETPAEPEKVPAGAGNNYHFHFHSKVEGKTADRFAWKVMRVAADGSLHSPERPAEWPGETAMDGGPEGIYAVRRADDPRLAAYFGRDRALVRVQVWGRVATHESGTRAQYAYPDSVILPDTPAAQLLAERVQARYPGLRGVVINKDAGFMKEAPGKEHMKGVSPKRNRQYEDILKSLQETHPDWSLDKCKEVAARTVNKERAEKGETKNSSDDGSAAAAYRKLRTQGVPTDDAMRQIAEQYYGGDVDAARAGVGRAAQLTGSKEAAGHIPSAIHQPKTPKGDSTSDRRDSIPDPVKCPECGSHTFELTNSEDKAFHCLACGNTFSSDHVETNPRGRKRSAERRYVQDSDGMPLRRGQYYRLHGSKFKVPDVVKVIDLADDGGITAQANDSPVPLRITLADVDDEGYSFEPIQGFQSDSHLHFFGFELEGEVKEGVSWDDGPVGPQQPVGKTCPNCGSPMQGDKCFNCGYSYGDQASARSPVPPGPTVSKTARRAFSPSEQRALVDEDGSARNIGKLNLEGTHYRHSSGEPDDELELLFL